MRNNIYDSDFFNYHTEYSLNSANEIIPLIKKYFSFNSVVDIGCGNGAWLSVFEKYDVKVLLGIDVGDLKDEEYKINKKNIINNFDLDRTIIPVDIKFDLLVCLEVVEHLKKRNSEKFIGNITKISDVILFSAAIPGQLGVNHVNEQLPDFWRKKFAKYNFIELNLLRPLLWNNSLVAWWYKQNITLYVNKQIINSNQNLLHIYNQQEEYLKKNERLTLVSERILKQYQNKIFFDIYYFVKHKLFKRY
jgi:SAM-dependent methyltransferase